MDLLNHFGGHRRGVLDGPARRLPGAVAVMDLGEPLLNQHGLAVRGVRLVDTQIR